MIRLETRLSFEQSQIETRSSGGTSTKLSVCDWCECYSRIADKQNFKLKVELQTESKSCISTFMNMFCVFVCF